MDNKTILIQEAGELVKRDFELNHSQAFLTEEELLQSLADHIAYMLEYQMENLLSSMYRMDINETKVRAALHPSAPEPANIGFARLIIDRQKKRIATKLEYKQPTSNDWFDF